MTGRRRLGAIVAVTALGMVAVGLWSARASANHSANQRDPAAYQEYVSTYVGGWSDGSNGPQRDQAWVAAHPDQLLAAGDRACSWLVGRPDAPSVDPTGKTSVEALLTEYLGVDFAQWPSGVLPYDAPGSDIGVTLSPTGRSTVVAGAWAYLCPSTREAKTAPRTLDED